MIKAGFAVTMHRSDAMPRRNGWLLPFVAVVLLIGGMGMAAPTVAWAHGGEDRRSKSHEGEGAAGAVGATVEEVLEIVHQMNPELAAMALEAEAAAARAQAADKLPDPKFALRYDEWPRATTSYGPSLSRIGTVKYELTQEIPLGGKLSLKREQAEAGHRETQHQQQATARDLAQRVKGTYAEYHQAGEALKQIDGLRGTVRQLAQFALARYRQGLGTQVDTIQADLEGKELEAQRVQMVLEQRLARIRLNALLNRPADAPLAAVTRLRRVPPATGLDAATLVERARQANPALRAQQAKIDAADRGRDLADRSWVPDLGIGVGVVQKDGRLDAYEAMVEVNIPLQWGLREAQQREAAAMASSARSRLIQAERQLESELHQAWAALMAAQEREKILREGQVPQAEAALRTASKAYELGLAEFLSVLEAERRLRTLHLDRLKLQLEQQMRLAEIERLTGEDL